MACARARERTGPIFEKNGFLRATDGNFNGIVDPKSKNYWLTINIEVTNLSNITRASSSDLYFYLVLPNGELAEKSTASGLKSPSSMELIKNGKGEATVSFTVLKTTNLSNLKLIIRSPISDYKDQDNFFLIK